VKPGVVRLLSKYGSLGPLVWLATVVATAAVSPGFPSPSNGLLPEGDAAFLFNTGMLMAGSLSMLLSAGLYEFSEGELVGVAGAVSLLSYGFATCVSGFMLVDLGEVQEVAQYLVQISALASTALTFLFLWGRGWRGFPVAMVCAAALGLAIGVAQGVGPVEPGLPFQASFNLWQAALGYRLATTPLEDLAPAEPPH